MRYDIQSEIKQLKEEIVRLKQELNGCKDLYYNATEHICSLEHMVHVLTENNDQYAAWFRNHEHIVTTRPEPITGPATLYHPVDVNS